MREALAVVVMASLFALFTGMSAEAVVAHEDADEARVRMAQAEAWANEMEWMVLQNVSARDSICDCTYNLKEDPQANHLRHAAAIHCARCTLTTRMRYPQPHDDDEP
jgi:hypothetical protein